jgi:hypothetical protein
MSNLRATDKSIFTIATLVLVILSYLLYDDSFFTSSNISVNLKNIGSVSISQNDVRRKNLDTFSWIPASKKDLIFQNDSIFTGDHSIATIKLDDGTQIHLEPNSLISLNITKGEMKLNLRYGNLVSDIAKNTSLIVKSGNDEIKIQGSTKKNEKSQIRFRKVHSESVDLKLISGTALIIDKKKEAKTELTKDSITSMNSEGEIKKAPTIPITLNIINVKAERVRISPFDPIGFEWSSTGEVSRYQLEFSKTEDFKNVTLVRQTTELNIQLLDFLEPGTSYWRVKAFDKMEEQAKVSPAQVLSLRYMDPPLILSPLALSELNLELEQDDEQAQPPLTSLKMQWKAPSVFKIFRYQISTDADFTNIIKQDTTTQLEMLTPNLPSGAYWIRVAAQTEKKISSNWSAKVPFKINLTVKRDTAPTRPSLMTEKVQFNTSQNKERSLASSFGPQIEWKNIPEAAKYTVQISKSKDFQDSETIDSLKNQIVWDKFKPGSFYFRVYALSKKDKKSEPSKIGYLQVQMASPLLSTINPLEAAGEIIPKKEALITWTKIQDATSYIVQLSENDNFSTPQEFEFEANSAQLTITKPGLYKVHVKAMNKYKEPITPYSSAESFIYKFNLRLRTPTPLEPYNNSSIFLQKLEEQSIWVEWNKTQGAEEYLVEISDEPEFSHLITSKSLEKNFLLINEKLPAGKIYWRVRSQTKDRKVFSEWTKPQAFTIYNQKNETF